MDVERNFISCITNTAEMAPALDARITEEFFEGEESRKVWGWCLEYYGRYARVPTGSALRVVWPEYRLIKTHEPLSFYVDQLQEQRKRVIVSEGMLAAYNAGNNVEDILKAHSKTLMMIGQQLANLRYDDLTPAGLERLDYYKKLAGLPGGLRGYPLSWITLDKALSGIQAEQFIVVIGISKAGKSTFMMRSAISVHDYGKEPLFLSFEMSTDEQAARYDAMQAQINYSHLLTGKLTKAEERALAKAAVRQADTQRRFIIGSDVTSATTVSGVASKIDEYNPDALFIDGVYLMDDELGERKGSPQALTNITRGLKRLAQSRRIPIVGSTQALESRYGASRGLQSKDVGWSSSFAQDCDALIGVERTDEVGIARLSIVHARNAPSLSVLVRWDWETSTFEEVSEEVDSLGSGSSSSWYPSGA